MRIQRASGDSAYHPKIPETRFLGGEAARSRLKHAETLDPGNTWLGRGYDDVIGCFGCLVPDSE
jgi:hypothetical protein